MTRAFHRDNERSQGNGNGGGRRSNADQVLASGVGNTVGRAFGSTRGKGGRKGMSQAWNAFHPCHLPLPRAVGPYTVIRTSFLHTSSAKYLQFGAFMRSDLESWSNVVGVEDVIIGSPVNATNNARLIAVPAPFAASVAGSSFTCVPSAVSVQVMSPGPLNTVHGQVAMAVCPTQLDVNGRTATWDALSADVTSFMRPRMCAVSKLALRGVQMNSYPLNQNAVSDFLPCTPSVHGSEFTLDGSALKPIGWTPMVVINENNAELNYMVCVEWRVRFDIGNAAVASHTHHGVTPDAVWNEHIENAVAMGNGVRDIVEMVASVGNALGQASALVA